MAGAEGWIGAVGWGMVILGLGMAGVCPVQAEEGDTADSGEVRAVWASRYQWASTSPPAARANITALMDGMTF